MKDILTVLIQGTRRQRLSLTACGSRDGIDSLGGRSEPRLKLSSVQHHLSRTYHVKALFQADPQDMRKSVIYTYYICNM